MLESVIEKTCTGFAKKLGWKAYKASSPGRRGQHDHIYHKNSITFYIEYKATGKNATEKQQLRAEELKTAGIVCRCFDSIKKAKEFINKMDLISDGCSFMLETYEELSQDISSFYK